MLIAVNNDESVLHAPVFDSRSPVTRVLHVSHPLPVFAQLARKRSSVSLRPSLYELRSRIRKKRKICPPFVQVHAFQSFFFLLLLLNSSNNRITPSLTRPNGVNSTTNQTLTGRNHVVTRIILHPITNSWRNYPRTNESTIRTSSYLLNED